MPAAGATPFWMDDPAPVEALRFRRVPLFAAAVAFAVGEWLVGDGQLAFALAAATVLLLLLMLLAWHKALRVAVVPVLGFWVVAGCWCAQMQPAPPRQAELRSYADGLSRTVRGRVVRVRLLLAPPTTAQATLEPPRPWLLEPGAAEGEGSAPTESVDLDVLAAEDVTPDTSTLRPVGGGLRLTLLDGTLPLACGDLVDLPLRFREPELYRDAGAPSYADQLASEGILATGSVKAAKLTRLPEPDQTGKLPSASQARCRLHAAQHWASARLAAFVGSPANRLLPAPARLTADDAGMLAAMLFGDRDALRRDLRVGFERTGSFHLFVVSGMHIGLLAGLLFVLLRKARAPLGLATIVTLLGMTAYAALTGFGVPVQRALLMATVFLTARWLWREISILQAIGAAALAVLAYDPRAVHEASFQMTFLALVAVGGLALPLAERRLLPTLRATRDLDAKWLDARLPPGLAQLRLTLRLFGTALAALPLYLLPMPKRFRANLPAFLLRLLLRAAELALVGVVVEACMAVPMAVYFHRATPFALPANILAVPLVAVLAPLAVAMFCASLVSQWVALLPAALTALAIHAVRAVIATLSHARLADARVPAPATAVLFAAVLLIAFACWAVRRRSRWVLAAGVAALACVPLAALWPEPPVLHPGTLEVTALDVGQGDSLLVVSPEGRTLLVDAGGPVGIAALANNGQSKSGWDVGEEVVAPYLWSRRLRRLDAVLLTHAHSDHMGGMPAILRDFCPRELWVSLAPDDSPDYRALLTLAAELGVKVRYFRAGDTFAWAGTEATVLSPEARYESSGGPVNDDSLVVRLDYGKASVLLEGDAERPSEETMLATGRLASVTLLKVGHHGSKTSTNPEFLAAVAPREAVISDGRRNTFGHPRAEVLERLEAAHVKTFRTDREGATTFLLTADGGIRTQSATQ